MMRTSVQEQRGGARAGAVGAGLGHGRVQHEQRLGRGIHRLHRCHLERVLRVQAQDAHLRRSILKLAISY